MTIRCFRMPVYAAQQHRCAVWEAAIYEQDEEKMARAVKKILMLHAYLLVQSGIPVIYSGDEIGQLNDCSYKESDDADKAADSRYIHRGKFQWAMAAKRHQEGTTAAANFRKTVRYGKYTVCP